MKTCYFKEIFFLVVISALSTVSTLTAFGQETATIDEMEITSVAIRDLRDFTISKIAGKNGEKEIVIENLGKGFEKSISLQLVDMGIDEKGEIRQKEGSNVLIAQIEYEGKLFSINFEAGKKLKYRIENGNAVILFDESYCLEIEEGIIEIPADFDPSKYVNITLEEFNKWENAKSEEAGLFKATVYHIAVTDPIARIISGAKDGYSFSDTQREGGRGVVLYQFNSKNKSARIKDGQKAIIYFRANSKDGFQGRIIDYIEIIE